MNSLNIKLLYAKYKEYIHICMYNMYLSLMKDVSDTNTFFSTALAVRQVLRTQLSVDH